MRTLIAAVAVSLLAVPALAQWSDNFDSYPLGSINGLGGWKGWDNVAAAAGTVSNVQAFSAPNSQQIQGAHDSIQEYTGYTSGAWVYSTKVYTPTDFVGGPGTDPGSFFIMMSKYTAGSHTTDVWTVQMGFNSVNGMIEADCGSSAAVMKPFVKGQWAEIKVEIYLDQDWTKVYYNGSLFDDPNVPNHATLGGGYAWTKGVFGQNAGTKNIALVDLFANNSTPMYYDDMSLAVIPEPTSLMVLALLLGLRRR